MANQELLNYIKESLAQGVSVEQIKQDLLEVGWSENEVDEALGGNSFSLKEKEIEFLKKPGESSFIKTRLFKLIISVCVLGLGIASLFVFRDMGGEEKLGPELEPILKSEENLIVAFVESVSSVEELGVGIHNERVVFYDLSTQSRLEGIVDLVKPGTMYSLGPWSPDGKYLPILASTLPGGVAGEDLAKERLFMYHGQEHLVKKVHERHQTEDSEEAITYSHINWTSSWLDEERLVYDYSMGEGDKRNIKYITINGEKGELVASGFKQKNNVLLVEISSRISETGFEKIVGKIYVRGEEIDVKPEGDIIGLVGNQIVSFKKIVLSSAMADFLSGEVGPELMAEIEKIESSNLSEEEKSQKILELFEPETSSEIHLTNINTGEVEKITSFDEDSWKTWEVQAVPDQSFLVIHQADSELSPSKHRILKVLLEDPENREVLVSEDVVGDSFMTSFLEEGVTFHLSADGRWLIYYKDKDQKPFNRNIVALSLFNNEKKILCDTSCQYYRVYNPFQLKLGY